MCIGGSNVPEPTPAQTPPTLFDESVSGARDKENRQNRAAAGAQSTILSRLMAPLRKGKSLEGANVLGGGSNSADRAPAM